jgi:Protein of unknown function (DUF3253)
MTTPFEDAILQLLAERPAGKSIEAMDVAKVVDPDNWRHRLGHVRAEAVNLAKTGQIVILRHNKPADPERFRGVYRLRLPLPGDVIPKVEPDDIEIGDLED